MSIRNHDYKNLKVHLEYLFQIQCLSNACDTKLVHPMIPVAPLEQVLLTGSEFVASAWSNMTSVPCILEEYQTRYFMAYFDSATCPSQHVT